MFDISHHFFLFISTIWRISNQFLGLRLSNSLVKHIGGQVQITPTGSAQFGPVNNIENTIRNKFNINGFCGKFPRGFVIELLKVAAAKSFCRRSVGETRKAVYGEDDLRQAGEISVGRGGVTGGWIIVEGDESNSEGNKAVGEGAEELHQTPKPPIHPLSINDNGGVEGKGVAGSSRNDFAMKRECFYWGCSWWRWFPLKGGGFTEGLWLGKLVFAREISQGFIVEGGGFCWRGRGKSVGEGLGGGVAGPRWGMGIGW
ncbi:unnamed protein product [Ilex paraguariensis]|uniref:Uncharacterized protein n=1 Tax=Ilex paraguariensis TaxID=185542 RepID=A0ABC8R4T5_9AQUA